MGYQGFFDILMITLISRKIRGGYRLMKHTVSSDLFFFSYFTGKLGCSGKSYSSFSRRVSFSIKQHLLSDVLIYECLFKILKSAIFSCKILWNLKITLKKRALTQLCAIYLDPMETSRFGLVLMESWTILTRMAMKLQSICILMAIRNTFRLLNSTGKFWKMKLKTRRLPLLD